jgi:hypothetical protein
LEQLIAPESKQRLRCQICFDAPSCPIGDEDGVLRPAEECAKVVVGDGDRLDAHVMAPRLTVLLVQH